MVWVFEIIKGADSSYLLFMKTNSVQTCQPRHRLRPGPTLSLILFALGAPGEPDEPAVVWAALKAFELHHDVDIWGHVQCQVKARSDATGLMELLF